MVNKVVSATGWLALCGDFYNAATVGGARALGRDDLGRLAPGCVADISIFNLPPLTAGPVDDPLRTLIHFCNRHNCDTVLVDGKVVVEAGRVVGVDEEELGARTQDAWLRYKAGIVARNHANRSSQEMFPPLLPSCDGRRRASLLRPDHVRAPCAQVPPRECRPALRLSRPHPPSRSRWSSRVRWPAPAPSTLRPRGRRRVPPRSAPPRR